jgi:cell division protein FtsW
LRHAGFLSIGFLMAIFVHRIPNNYFSNLSILFVALSLVLLVLTLIFGETDDEATRRLKILGISFQTSDLAKFAMIMFIARILSKNQHDMGNYKKVIVPILAILLPMCGLILPSNLSTAALLFLASIILMFIGNVRYKHLFVLFSTIIGTLLLISVVSRPFTDKFRIETWINRVVDFYENMDGNIQVRQAKTAVVSAGVFGKGPGNGTQRSFLPEAQSDYVYAMIVEEYGIFGSAFVFFIYIVLLYRAGVILRRCPHHFGGLLAAGLSISLVLQAMVNIAVSLSMMPVTGQTLPLISMGGTSIIFTSASLGIILSVSNSPRKIEKI